MCSYIHKYHNVRFAQVVKAKSIGVRNVPLEHCANCLCR